MTRSARRMADLVDLFVPLESLEEPLEVLAARALGRAPSQLEAVRVVRRSLDARKDRPLGYRLRLEVRRPGDPLPAPRPRPRRPWPAGVPAPRVVIVGSGPAGAWAALRLAEAGVPATVIERGKPVQPRRRDLAALQRGTLEPSSNYCFGEGGAGTYSDGKLYTRTKDRDAVAEVLGDLVRFGAPADIEVEARPHVGSNRLPRVLAALRAHLETAGVEYRFETELAAVELSGGRVRAVRTRAGEDLSADVVVLAVGHSASDVYRWAAGAGVAMERKDLAVGVRLEHPQPVIDALQYGRAAGDPRLPPAFYQLSATGGGRGVYSFCMCPGGWVVPAATEPDGVVVNGMSLSRRDSPFANAGMVVAISAADFGPAAGGPLAGMAFQRGIERLAFQAGGGGFRVPGQRLVDFLAARPSASLPETSYRPGVVAAPLEGVFPAFVIAALREGLAALARKLPGFAHPDGVLLAAETRTSAPVRFIRDPRTLESPSATGLYPCGEGAGHAGGIVSAALDGAQVAAAIIARAR
jgi:uncharacterized protein